MSSAEYLNDALARDPEFDLEYSFNDHMHPSEVTIFPRDASAGIMTNWLTMDIGHVVPVEECR